MNYDGFFVCSLELSARMIRSPSLLALALPSFVGSLERNRRDALGPWSPKCHAGKDYLYMSECDKETITCGLNWRKIDRCHRSFLMKGVKVQCSKHQFPVAT